MASKTCKTPKKFVDSKDVALELANVIAKEQDERNRRKVYNGHDSPGDQATKPARQLGKKTAKKSEKVMKVKEQLRAQAAMKAKERRTRAKATIRHSRDSAKSDSDSGVRRKRVTFV